MSSSSSRPALSFSFSTSYTPTPTPTLPPQLVSIAESLLSSYYPSATISNLATLSLPSTVVINSSTYILHDGSTTTSSPTPKPTHHSTKSTKSTASTTSSPAPSSTLSSANTSHSHDASGDQTLSIVLGVVMGVIAVALMATLFFCLWRRKKTTGSFFISRASPPTTRQSSFRRWPAAALGRFNSTRTTTDNNNEDDNDIAEKQPSMSVVPVGWHSPPLHSHPVFTHRQNLHNPPSPYHTIGDLHQNEWSGCQPLHPTTPPPPSGPNPNPDQGSHGETPLLPSIAAFRRASQTSQVPPADLPRRGANNHHKVPRKPVRSAPPLVIPHSSFTSHTAKAPASLSPRNAEEEEESRDLISPLTPPGAPPQGGRSNPARAAAGDSWGSTASSVSSGGGLVHWPSREEVRGFDFVGGNNGYPYGYGYGNGWRRGSNDGRRGWGV